MVNNLSVWVAGRELKFGMTIRCLLTNNNKYLYLDFFVICSRVSLKNSEIFLKNGNFFV
jgi:hypothetical protein